MRGIFTYTPSSGDAQARRYIAGLQRAVEAIAADRGPFKDMTALHPGLRMVKSEHHHIFCLMRDGAPPLILAIFHERMDLMTRLADRLK